MSKKKNKKIINILRDNPLTLGELAAELKQSKTQCKRDLRDLKILGVYVARERIDNKTKYYIPLKMPTTEPRKVDTDYFALIGDTHLGSKYAEEECLNDFFDICDESGIKDVFHAGDIGDGVMVYDGQINDLLPEALTLQDQIQYIIEHYPRKKNIKQKLVSGNHDTKQFKRQGVDIAKSVADRRKDIEHIGQSYGRIRLKDDVLLEIAHPTGTCPYAKDYRFRTYLRERPINNYPDILALGHLHSSIFTDIQGTQSYMVGCFLGDTEFTRRRGLNPAIGGWIVDLDIEDGKIKRNRSEWVKY